MAKSPTGRVVTNFQSIGGRSAVYLKGLDVGEKLRTIPLLLADGRQGLDGSELHVHARHLILSDRDVMASYSRRTQDLGENPMNSILWLCGGGRGGQTDWSALVPESACRDPAPGKRARRCRSRGRPHARSTPVCPRAPSTGVDSPASDSFRSSRSAHAWGSRAAFASRSPLNFVRVQNFAAVSPSGVPRGLEPDSNASASRIRSPHWAGPPDARHRWPW